MSGVLRSGSAVYNSGVMFNFPSPTRPIRDQQAQFYLELHACDAERAFLNALWGSPDDKDVRGQYSDWLLEHNRPTSAEMIRSGWTPGFV